MKKYTKYDAETGDIILNFITSEKDLELNKPFIEGWFKKEEYIIVNGLPQELNIEPVEQTEKYALAVLRSERTALLSASDWTQVPDAPVDQAAWATYRQQLRDLPENTEDPANPTWPSIPT